MTLIVEDGSQVDNSNTYVSLADARAVLAPFGQNIDASDAIAEQQLLMAMSYIEAFRAQFKGTKNTREQSLQWPRFNVVIDGYVINNDEMPQELINAQVYAAYEIDQGEFLQDNSEGLSISSEEVVGKVKVAYFDTGAIEGSTTFVRVKDELNVLINGGFNRSLRGRRG